MKYFPQKIELKWQKRWLRERTYEPDLQHAKRPFYNLMMFPYPSAEGLHVGNMYAFVGSDIFGRLMRMQAHDVFEPIGLDGFGIHSENYALQIGRHPAKQAKLSEKNFYRQLAMLGNGFAWGERLETYDPDYYRWTQWIFAEMFRRGLAYRKRQAVNWCPSCKTVLADEQVIAGRCERCGAAVIKKELEQWFFKITAYAERLLKNLEKIDWSERVKIAQRNWIGKSEGALIRFPILWKSDFHSFHSIEVFTTRPDTLFGATFLAVSPELAQSWLDLGWQAEVRVQAYIKKSLAARAKRGDAPAAKTGVFSGVWAENPANKEKIPVWVADYVLAGYGSGAIMGVPAHDERDYAFAKKFKLPITIVVCPHYPKTTCPILTEAYTGPGHLVASGRFDGLPSEEAKGAITEAVGGKRKTQFRLRDWLISRQRYWGPPIPIIYCRKCWEQIANSKSQMAKLRYGIDYATFDDKEFMIHAVPEKDLPVKLPYIKNFRPTGTDKSPLTTSEKFYRVRCPKCRSWALRETDVSDTFLDSAWYYLRYPSVRDSKHPWDPAVTKKWLPVDMYIGGAEHAVLHLLYVRFLAMVFHDWGLTHFKEPFKKFRAHGLLISGGTKMSKSRGNVVNPDEYIRAYGADALRMYLMFLGPFEQGGDFRDTGIRGITRFLDRVWSLGIGKRFRTKPSEATERELHRAIAKVSRDVADLQYNTAIAALMVLWNAFTAAGGEPTRDQFKVFLQLLAPFAPFVTEELWRTVLREPKSIHRSRWPQADPRSLRAATTVLVIQVNGRVRDRIAVVAGLRESDVRELVLARPKVRAWLAGKTIRRFIYVPGRIANIVA